jgi:hypothetical protein
MWRGLTFRGSQRQLRSQLQLVVREVFLPIRLSLLPSCNTLVMLLLLGGTLSFRLFCRGAVGQVQGCYAVLVVSLRAYTV